MTIRLRMLVVFTALSFSCSDPAPTPSKSKTPIQSPPATYSPPYMPCPGQFFCFASHNFDWVNYSANWEFPGAYGASASAADKVFFAGGHEEGSIGFTWSAVTVFNTRYGNWLYTVLSIPRSHLAGASAGDKVLFAGGNNIASMNPVYGAAPLEYYDVVDIYYGEKLATDISHLSEKRGYMASVSTPTKAYFIGGKTLEGFSSKMDIYDAELNSWTVVEMPRARAYSSAAFASGKIYISGGQNSEGNLTLTDVYDVVTGQWSFIETPHEHPVASSGVLGDRIFVAGGDGETNNAVDIFNTVDQTWTSTNLSDSRNNIAVAGASNKLIFFGGSFSRNVDVYDELYDSWSVATLSDGVDGVAACSTLDKCFFMGFLYENGNALTNSMITIQP